MRTLSLHHLFAASVLALVAALPAAAQTSVPLGEQIPFRDTSMLKPPAGAKVAILEFEDLECPGCAAAYPVVKAALEHYKIPYVRYDFLIRAHVWSSDAAVTARYLQDKVSPEKAEEFRGDVFKNQPTIASKDDLNHFTMNWFKQHGLQLPFVMDPTGLFKKEVELDCNLGVRLNLHGRPRRSWW